MDGSSEKDLFIANKSPFCQKRAFYFDFLREKRYYIGNGFLVNIVPGIATLKLFPEFGLRPEIILEITDDVVVNIKNNISEVISMIISTLISINKK